MTFSGNREWTNIEKLDGLEKWILVHSHLYYDTAKTVISDQMFDKNCWQLVDLIRECTQEEREASRWWYVFNNFDGCTGYDLFMRLNSDDQHYIDDMCGMVIWGVETEVKPFGIGMGYNLMFYLTILLDILVWPFGIVTLIRGVMRIRRNGNTEITKRAEELEKRFHKG